METPPLIRMHGIRRTFTIGDTEVEILKGVNLDIEAGQMVSIMGTSGGGKSTLMNIIGLLDSPTEGSYYLEGREISDIDDMELSTIRNQKIGFVFQQFHLLPKLTALDNVCLPLVYRGISEKDQHEKAREMLEKVSMSDREHHRPTELSGGQQQRVAIARALVGSPSIILADEPTGALDSKVGQEIMSLFLELNQEERITTVLITHDPKVAKQCQRVVRIQDGITRE